MLSNTLLFGYPGCLVIEQCKKKGNNSSLLGKQALSFYVVAQFRFTTAEKTSPFWKTAFSKDSESFNSNNFLFF